MTGWILRSGASVIACVLFSPGEASAKGIIVITWGETISHLGDVSSQKQRDHGVSKVGYKYKYFGVFWVNLWTSDGAYCVYEGDRYSAVEPKEAAYLLGRSDGDVSPPLLYTFPLGWLILAPLIGIGIIVSIRDKMKTKAIMRLFEVPIYQTALQILHTEYAKQAPPQAPVEGQPAGETQVPGPRTEPVAPPSPDDGERYRVAFAAAVEHLVNSGVARDEAVRNLAAMVHVLTNPGQG